MANETRTDIANIALDILGRGPIEDVDGATQKGELERRLKGRIDHAVDAMLRIHKWPASRETQFLPGASLNADENYYYEIQLPTDCVAVWKVGDEEDGWERRSGQGAGSVVTRLMPPVRVEYARRISPDQMTEEMRQVAGVMLADMLKQHAAISTARRQEIAAERVRLIKEAVRVAGSEDGPDTPFTSPWLNAMLGV